MNTNTVLVIGYVWPEPQSSAAGARMMQLLEFFQKENYKVVFASTATHTNFSASLTSRGIASEKIELNNTSFDIFLKKTAPEIVIFDRYITEEQFGWRVAEICPAALRILNTEDLHFLRKARQQAVKNAENLTTSLMFSDLAKREIACIYRCDLSLIISEVELQLLVETFKIPSQLLFYLPFMLQEVSESKKIELLPFSERKNFISIGNFLHDPNKDAVLQLKFEIWPLLRKQIKEAELHIFGAYVPEAIRQLHNEQEKFLIKGRAVSAKHELEKSRLLLAPLRFGAGIKGKFTDAMQTGTPNITTSIGSEGMTENVIWSGAICDDVSDFVAMAAAFYTDEEKWLQAQKNGFSIVATKFSEVKHHRRFTGILQKLSENLEEHRLQNFTGLMLQHHSLQSTKYLSKYIEFKNKT